MEKKILEFVGSKNTVLFGKINKLLLITFHELQIGIFC